MIGRRDKAKRTTKHMEDIERKTKHMTEIEAKFVEHNLLQEEKNELKHEHSDFLCRQVREEKERCDREDMTNELTILKSSEEGVSQEDVKVLRVMKAMIRTKHWGN